MHTQKDVVETLRIAKDLQKTGWGFLRVGTLIRSAARAYAGARDLEGVSAAALDYFENAYDGSESIEAWNEDRTREEVLHTFSLAIQMAEKDLNEQARAEISVGTAANTESVTEAA